MIRSAPFPARWFLSLALACMLAPRARAAEPAAAPEVTPDEFKLFRDYEAALTDERVQKIPEAKRLAAIAKNFKVKDAVLKAAVDKVQPVSNTLGPRCEAETRKLLEAGTLKGRVREVNADTASGHAVIYVSWTNVDGAKLEEEAATAALAAAKGSSIASTVAVWALDGAGTKVFEAKISASAASRFNEKRIPDFAAARYINQFEAVKNAYKGTPPAPN